MNRIAVAFCMGLILLTTSHIARCQATSGEVPLEVSFVQAGGYGNTATFQIALGDLDQDGDLDAVFSNMHQHAEVWMNDGSGHFRNSYQLLGIDAHGVGIGDLDGDGDLDLLITRASDAAGSRVYFNNGAGRFTAARENLGDVAPVGNALTLFDVEGDGDLDAGIYYFDGLRHCRLYINDGTGTFSQTPQRFPGLAAWGDVDADGDVDAVLLQHEQNGSGYKVYSNVDGVRFEESQHINAPGMFFPGIISLGDLDGDGDLDLVAGGGDALNAPLTVLTNTGAGVFILAPSGTESVRVGRVALGDFNADGTDDVFIGSSDRPKQVFLCSTSGECTDSGLLLGTDAMAGISAIGDLDGDGDLDLFISVYGHGGPNEVWLNTTGE